MTKTQIINLGRNVLKEHGINFRFRKDISISGCYPKDSYIVIGYKGYREDDLASAITHELAHVLNFRERKYYNYHNYGANTRITRNGARNQIRIGLKAEKYTDKRAKSLMKTYFPQHDFWAGYSDKSTQVWYREYFLGPFREFLKRHK